MRDLERDAYGRGARGAVVQLVSEGRLPSETVHRGRTLARRMGGALVVTTVLVATTLLLVLAAVAAAVLQVLGVL